MRHTAGQSLILLLLGITSFIPSVRAQAADVDCPDSTLTSYLLTLIDTLYANGLTHYESLLATLSESDSGYDLLTSWYSDDSLTLFVPTDAAMQSAGIVPPFDKLTEKEITDMVALHTVSGKWEYGNLPASPAKGFADSLLTLKELMNDTKVDSKAHAPLVLQQADQGSISIRLASGNSTTWGWVINGEKENYNLVIIPIDTVIPFPPKLSEALTMANTSRSTKGLSEFTKALDMAGGAQQLESLTEGGFTIFAPIDDAFTTDINRALTSNTEAVKILGNHYATNYSLFSRIWVDNGPFQMPVISGESLLVQQADSGATITLGEQAIRILRSDIAIENGVMHIIEDVIADPKVVATASGTPTSSRAGTPSGSRSAGANNTTAQQGTGAGFRQTGVGRGLALSSILIVLSAVL